MKGNLIILSAFLFLFIAQYIQNTYNVMMSDYGFPLFVCYIVTFTVTLTMGIMQKFRDMK